MAGGVGTLTVGLGLDAAQFTQGLTKAQAQAQAFATQTKATFVGALGAGLTRDLIRGLAEIPAAFLGAIRGAIDAADHLNDLSKKTGIAADSLGGIGFAAKQAGLDLDSVSAGTGKLNRSLAEAAAGNKEAIAAFAALGVSVTDASGATKKADVALAEIADKFAGYADGPEKAALAIKIFGKAGADMIPLLNDGGAALQGNIAYFKRYSGVTVEAAQAADQFNDTLTKINLLKQAFGNTVAADLLGPLQAIAQRFLESKEQGDGFKTTADLIKGSLVGIASTASFVVESLSAVSARLSGLIERAQALSQFREEARAANPLDVFGTGKATFGDSSKLKSQFAAIGKTVDDEVAKAQKRHDRFVSALNFTPDSADYSNEGRNRVRKPAAAPRIPGTGSGDDPTKKILEDGLKAIEGAIAREKDLLATRNRFLEFYNSESLISIQDYYAGRQVAQDQAQKAEIDGFNREIGLLREYQAKKTTSQVDKAGAEVKITELIDKRSKAETAAGEAGILGLLQQQRAYKQLADEILGVSAQVLDLKENFAQAAAIRFDLQFDALSKTFTANGNTAGLEAIAALRAAAIAQGAFQKASLDASRTLDELAQKEERLTLAQQTGAITSLEGLAKLGEARRAQIPILEAQVKAEEAIAAAARSSGTAGADDLARKADASRLALDKLKASADPLAESLNKTFGGDFNTALDDFVTGTKSAADAFKSFAKSVLNDILKLGSKSITESIFGGSGGAGGLISSLFSSGSAQGGASSAGGLLSSFASLFSGFFADGGTIPAGQFGVVGERGPELAFGGATGKTISPIAASSSTIVVNVTAQPGMSRDSALQQGAAIAQGIDMARARNL